MSSFEHHATVDKGLKMKIKRKNLNGEKNEKSKKEQKPSENKAQSENLQSTNGMLSDTKSAKLSLFSDKEKSPKSKLAQGKKEKGKGLVKSDSSASVSNTSLNGLDGLFTATNSMEPKLGETAAGKKDCVPDPYEFNAKVEDGISMPIKKMKLEKEKQGETTMTVPSASGSSVSTHDASTDTHDVAIVTDPDCLGPCEPGTQVTLEGIVWHESENGVLVVNVTWRGKTYVGTLLDATRHDWAPPRFNCDSPTMEFESRTPKGRGKRRGAANTPVQDTRTLRKGRRGSSVQTFTAPPSPAKSDISVGGLKRKGRPQDIDLSAAEQRCSKRSRSGSQAPTPSIETPPVDAQGYLECPEPNCNKKYKNANGLKYHQSHAHSSSNSNTSADDAREEMDTEDIPLSVVKNAVRKDKETKKDISVNKKESTKENSSNLDKGKTDKSDVTSKKSDKEDNDSDTKEEMNKADGKSESSNTPKKKENSGIKTPVNQSGGKTAISQSSLTKSSSNLSNTASSSVTTSSQSSSSSVQVITSQTSSSSLATSATTSVVQSASQGEKSDTKLVDIKPKITVDMRVSKPNRPIVPAPTHTVLSNVQVTHSNLSPVMSHTQMSPQLKPIQPKPTIMGEPQNINPALADLNKDRKKAQKKRPKDGNSQNKPDQPAIKVERTGVIKTNPMPNRQGDLSKREGIGMKDGSRPGMGDISQRSHGLAPPNKSVDLQHSRGSQNPNLLKVGSPLQVNTPDSQKGALSDDVQSPAYSDISDANESASPAAPSDSSPQKVKEEAQNNNNSKKEEKTESTPPQTTDGQMMPHYNMYSYYAQSPYRMNEMSPGQKSTGSNNGAPTPNSQSQEPSKTVPVPADKKNPDSQPKAEKKPEEKEPSGRPKGPTQHGYGPPPSNMSPQQLQEYQMQMYQQMYMQSLPQHVPYQYMVNGMYAVDPNYMKQMMEEHRIRAQSGEAGRMDREQGQGQERVPSRGPDQRAPGKKEETTSQKAMMSPGQVGERNDSRRLEDKNGNVKDKALRDKQNETHQILKENIDLKSEMDKQNYERYKKAEERRRHMFQEQKMIEERKKMDLARKGELRPESLASKAPGTKPIVEQTPRNVGAVQHASVELQSSRKDNSATKRDNRDSANTDPKLKDSRDAYPRDLSANKYSDSSKQGEDKSRTPVAEKHRSETPTRNPDTPKQRPGGSSSKSGSPLTSVSSSLPSSQAPYSPYVNSYPYMQGPHFMGMDPTLYRSHSVNPAMMPGYPGGAYIHPSQMGYRPGDEEKDKLLSSAQKPPSSDSDLKKGGDSGGHGPYYSNVHKIHELSEKGRPKSRNSSPGPVKSSDSSSGSFDKHRDYTNSPPTQRHVHTHHHTHVLQPGPGLQAGAPLQGHPGYSPVYDPYINSAIFVSQAQSPHPFPPK